MRESASVNRLDIIAIIETAEDLAIRIETCFPDRGINRLSQRLVEVANETNDEIAALARPRWMLRFIQTVFVVLIVASAFASLFVVGFKLELDTSSDVLAVSENLIQDAVFLGIATVFLMGTERRLKRRRVLTGLHNLRSIAHIIDMHQLSKNPDSLVHPATGRVSEDDKAELARYLDFCSEMLSITNKLAALYAQESQDPVVLATVGGVQDLTVALSSKMWQKVMILDVRSQ